MFLLLFSILLILFLFVFSWFVIFGASFTDVFGATQGASSGTATFFYAMAWIGVVVNAISIYLSHKLHIKVTGGILGLIGNLCLWLYGPFSFSCNCNFNYCLCVLIPYNILLKMS